MKYRVEVTESGDDLRIDVWHYAHSKENPRPNDPWVLVSSLAWVGGAAAPPQEEPR